MIAAAAALGAIAGGGVMFWRRNPRFGTTFVNEVVNPRLLRRADWPAEGCPRSAPSSTSVAPPASAG